MDTYEKKYKEALERAKEQLEGAKVFDYKEEQIAHDIRTVTYAIFPELKESEDERIRKTLIRFFKDSYHNETEMYGVTVGKALAWLEKQGEHAKFRESIQIGDEVTRNKDGMLVNLSQLKNLNMYES